MQPSSSKSALARAASPPVEKEEELMQLEGTREGQLEFEVDRQSIDNLSLADDDLDAPPSFFDQTSEYLLRSSRTSIYGPGVSLDDLDALYTPLQLNVVIHIVGSRGDVAPFIPIAQLLKDRGHRVRIATHARFAEWVRKHGLEFFTLGADPETLMAFMVKNGGLIPSIRSVAAGDIQKNRAELDKLIRGAYKSCTEPDEESGAEFVAHAIIANPPSFGSPHAAEALGVPIQIFSPMPWAPTSAFPHPFTNMKSVGDRRKFANLLSYEAVHQMTWTGCSDLVNATREEHGLGYASAASVNLAMSKIPQTYLISPTILPPPLDYGELIDVTGYSFQQPQTTPEGLPLEITSFLESGPLPVYCGFGSIVGFDLQKLYTQFIEAIHQLGLRAIVCTGWGNVVLPASNNVLVIKEAPHDLLLPYCSAVCHHGGAGTTAAGLRYGKPTMVIAFFGDQSFWGRVVAARGAGPLPINARSVTVEMLVEGLGTCLQPDVQTQASHIAELIAAERGAESAVHSFLARIPWERMASDLDASQVAAVTHKPTGKRLSVAEAQILILCGKIVLKDLERHQPVAFTLADEIDGSMNLVGSVTRGFSQGYTEAMKYTREGVTKRNPINVARGACSMVYHPVKGVFGMLGASSVGMNRIQRFYDSTYRPPSGKVTDFKSGLIEGGKSFAINYAQAITDIVVKPYQMGRKEGPVGAIKGLATGAANIPTKLSIAGLNFVVLPVKGLYRGLQSPRSPELLGKSFDPSRSPRGRDISATVAQQVGCSAEVVEITLALWSD